MRNNKIWINCNDINNYSANDTSILDLCGQGICNRQKISIEGIFWPEKRIEIE